MVDSFSEFEDELRGLVPAGCDRLTEDTFYRAGWKAAECGELRPGHLRGTKPAV